MKELCDPEDDEGFMPFMPFLEKMCSNELFRLLTNLGEKLTKEEAKNLMK